MFSLPFLSRPANSKGFRADINGLRALAVLGVLLYHFNIPGISGGFVGVDVFFVISGFLMASTILRAMESGKFTLLSFYGARVRRIVPALLAMLFACLLLGAIFLIPTDYEELSHQAAAASIFISNIILKGNGGYFAEELSQKWLLHTWSLGVEWQFYLLFPLLLMVLRYFQKGRWTGETLLVLFLISLGLCIWLTPLSPKPSFFMPHTRMWELLAGALVYHYRNLRSIPYQTYAGLTLIILAFLFIHESKQFPGWYPLVPVMGAMLVIHAHRNIWLFRNSIAQALGNISYSLYLWHWPVVIFGAYLFGKSLTITVVSIILSLILGGLSYLYVEKPARSIKTWPPRVIMAYTISLLIVGLGGVLVWKTHGLPQRLPADLREKITANEVLIKEWKFPNSCGNWNPIGPEGPHACTLGAKDASSTILVWGDSHGEQQYPVWQKLEPELLQHHKKAVLMTSGGCPPVRFTNRTEPKHFCHEFNESVFQYALRPEVQSVIISSYWQLYIADPSALKQVSPTQNFLHTPEQVLHVFKPTLTTDIRALQKAGKHVYLLQPIPVHKNPFAREWARTLWGRAHTDLGLDRITETQTMRDMIQEIADATGATVLDNTKIFCTTLTNCRTDIDGYALYKDGNHLTRFGAVEMAPLLRQVIDKPQ